MAAMKARTIPDAPAKLTWVDATSPTLAELQRAPVGTAYAFKESPGNHHVRVKTGVNRWLQLCDRTVAKAVAEWRTYVTAPPKGTGYFTIDVQVQKNLVQFADGLKRLG